MNSNFLSHRFLCEHLRLHCGFWEASTNLGELSSFITLTDFTSVWHFPVCVRVQLTSGAGACIGATANVDNVLKWDLASPHISRKSTIKPRHCVYVISSQKWDLASPHISRKSTIKPRHCVYAITSQDWMACNNIHFIKWKKNCKTNDLHSSSFLRGDIPKNTVTFLNGLST